VEEGAVSETEVSISERLILGILGPEEIGGGDGVDIELVGTVERLPEVVKGVKSRTSGKYTRIVFFDAYWP